MFEQTTIYKCATCGRWLSEGDGDNEVLHRVDPFKSDVHGDDTQMWLCGTCRHESAMDI